MGRDRRLLLLRLPRVSGHGRLGFTDIVIVLGFVSFGSVLQIPGVGGGMQIVTVLVLTEFYGVGLEAASGVALMLWLVSFVVIVPLGLALAFHEGIKWRSLKHIEAQEPEAMICPFCGHRRIASSTPAKARKATSFAAGGSASNAPGASPPMSAATRSLTWWSSATAGARNSTGRRSWKGF